MRRFILWHHLGVLRLAMAAKVLSKVCITCGTEFTFSIGRAKQKNDFCSSNCYHSVKRSVEQRFWRLVSPVSGSCWIWSGQKSKKGYGILDCRGIHKGVMFAHRASYVLHKGDIPEGLFVRHKCDTRACVNPDHLEVGTMKDNSDDMVARGRQTTFSKLTKDEVDIARKMGLSGSSCTEIGKFLDVSRKTISDILIGKTWRRHISVGFVAPNPATRVA